MLVVKMYGYEGFLGIDLNPERIPVERALVLSMNSVRTACAMVDGLDVERLVDAMYNPSENRGVVEDVLTKVLARGLLELKPLP
jgi:xylose isomerase